jgi:hypothetical protein
MAAGYPGYEVRGMSAVLRATECAVHCTVPFADKRERIRGCMMLANGVVFRPLCLGCHYNGGPAVGCVH